MVDEETGIKIFELRGHFQANPFNVRVNQVFKNAPSRNLFGMKGVFRFFWAFGVEIFRWDTLGTFRQSWMAVRS